MLINSKTPPGKKRSQTFKQKKNILTCRSDQTQQLPLTTLKFHAANLQPAHLNIRLTTKLWSNEHKLTILTCNISKYTNYCFEWPWKESVTRQWMKSTHAYIKVKCSYLYWQHKSNLGSSLLILWLLLSYSYFWFFPLFSPLGPSSPSPQPHLPPLLLLSLHLFESISVAATAELDATVAWFLALWRRVTLSLAGRGGVKKGGGRKVMDGGGEIELCKCQKRKGNQTNVSRLQ